MKCSVSWFGNGFTNVYNIQKFIELCSFSEFRLLYTNYAVISLIGNNVWEKI